MYITRQTRKIEYRGFVFEASYKNDIQEKIAEQDVIPYSPEVMYMLDSDGKPFRFFSMVEVTPSLVKMFLNNGFSLVGIEINPYRTSPIEELLERKYNETIDLLHEWGYPTYKEIETSAENKMVASA